MNQPAAAPASPGPPSPGPPLPEAAWVLALARLESMGPKRLSALLSVWPASEAWRRVADGSASRSPAVLEAAGPVSDATWPRWSAAARQTDVAELWRAHTDAGISVSVLGEDGHPERLAEGPDPAPIVFRRGRASVVPDASTPSVAVVGTRRCSAVGSSVAHELGHDLAAAGVVVVSGLALGIDGAAHEGALAAGDDHGAGRLPAAPVAVVGCGLDVAYPRRHRLLWERVTVAGAIVSEYPLGTPPDRWRFPARNRLVAALADVVVVVESARTGGSMHTVDAALALGRPVLAVPGSVRNPAAIGTNDLLAAGCAPVRDATDVLVALGLSDRRAPTEPVEAVGSGDGLSGASDLDLEPDATARVVLALGGEAATFEQLVARSGLSLAEAAGVVAGLERAGVLRRRGGWYVPGSIPGG